MARKPYEDTAVPVERSQAQLRKLLQKFGATGFGFGQDAANGTTRALVQFSHKGLAVRMRAPFDRNRIGRSGGFEREERRVWRILVHNVKARMVAVDAGLETLEEAFLAHVVNPGTGATIYEELSDTGTAALPRPLAALPKGDE